MILWLFALLIALSLVLVVIGLSNSDESAAAVIGFSFLFYLAIIMMTGEVAIKTGENISIDYTYQNDSGVELLGSTSQISVDNYTTFNDTHSQWFGRFLAAGSIAGFVGVMIGLKGKKKKRRGEYEDDDGPETGEF